MLGLGSSLLSPYLAEEAGYINTHALLLDGTNDGFDSNYSAQSILRAAGSDGFTISFWGNPDVTGRVPYGATTSPSTSGQFIATVSSGNLLTLIRANNTFAIELGGTVAVNEWHMYSVVITPGSGSSNIDIIHFVDGVDVSSTSSFNNVTYDDLALITIPDLGIGTQNVNGSFSVSGTWDGHIDQFAVWNGALSAAQLAALAAKPEHDYTIDLGNYASSGKLQAYYKFDNNADDSSGNGHDGEALNGALFDASNLPS